jgi:GH24 family phage-related lysozyme (muramidase)
VTSSNTAPITLEQLFRYWRDLPHQRAAIGELEADLSANGYAVAMRRDREWFKTWSTAGKQFDTSAALKLIREFEGCALIAYPDPLSGAAPWTIGYGATRYPDGREVQQYDKITVVEADTLLRLEVDHIAGKLNGTIPFWSAMKDQQRCALISFAYNLGSNFYSSNGFETITRRLTEKDWSKVPDALLLYCNPGTPVEAGLKRRREAEGRLWLQGIGLPEVQQQPAKLTPASSFSARLTPHITLGEFALGQEERRFRYPHQLDTAAELAAFLERCRVHFGGKPVIITSGYRPPEINRSVGGASQSEHLYDTKDTGAVDFYIDGVDVHKVQDWCDANWPYSVGYGASKGFVHLGIRPGRPRIRWDY